jgi:hypothetical protein
VSGADRDISSPLETTDLNGSADPVQVSLFEFSLVGWLRTSVAGRLSATRQSWQRKARLDAIADATSLAVETIRLAELVHMEQARAQQAQRDSETLLATVATSFGSRSARSSTRWRRCSGRSAPT